MKSTKILLLGSSGLFGTAFEKICNQNLINCTGLSHREVEITDRKQLEAQVEKYRPDVIVNSTAMMGIIPCEEDPKKAFEINAIAALNLARICQRNGTVMVQTSTNSVFDGRKGNLYFESDIPNPQNIYGLSKYAGEVCVKNNLSSWYIIRFPKLFGSRRNISLGLTDKIIERMKRGEDLKIAEDRFDPFTYSVHAARKVFSLLENGADFGVYHVANKGSISYYDFVCKFAEMVKFKGKIIKAKDSDFPSLAPNPLRIELGSEKINDMPSWIDALEEHIKMDNVKI